MMRTEQNRTQAKTQIGTNQLRVERVILIYICQKNRIILK